MCVIIANARYQKRKGIGMIKYLCERYTHMDIASCTAL